jgi:hypothetical protein
MRVFPKATWKALVGLAGQGKCNCGRIVVMVLYPSQVK